MRYISDDGLEGYFTPFQEAKMMKWLLQNIWMLI